jgi:hypothetical protein
MSGLSQKSSEWSFGKTAGSTMDAADFLSRCDEQGKLFFTSLFEAQKSASNHTKITWKHESGFSLHFYFHSLRFAPVVWGFPASNRDGRSTRQRLDFPFDRSLPAGVPEPFVNELGASLASILPLLGGAKRPSISIANLSSDDSSRIIETIFNFAAKASKVANG